MTEIDSTIKDKSIEKQKSAYSIYERKVLNNNKDRKGSKYLL